MHDDTAVPLDRLLAHRAWIRALARSLVRDHATVDDIEQDVYVAAMKGPRVKTSLRGWLRRVVRNAVYQRRRGDTRRSAREQAAGTRRVARNPDEIVSEADAHRHVVQTVMDLREPYCTTVLVRYFEGLSLQETADRLGVPREAVKTRLRRAHRMLRERLRREHGEERGSVPAILAPLVGGPAGLSDLLHSVPDAAVASRRWGPLAAAAGLVAAAALVGAAVHASTGGVDGNVNADGAAGVALAMAPTEDGDGGAGDDGAPEEPRERDADERTRVSQHPPLAQDTQPAPEESHASPADHFVVRDLLTREAIPHLALQVTHDGAATTLSADDAGRVAISPENVDEIRTGATTWIIPGSPAKHALHDGSLWVHRTVQIDVEVRDADPRRSIPLGKANVHHYVAGAPPGAGGDGPGSFTFLTRTRLGGFDEKFGVGADGRVRVRVPVVPGVHVSASAPGCRAVSAPVAITSVGASPVVLELRAGFSINGRIRNADGRSVPGAEIRIEVSRSGKGAPPDLGALRAEGGGGMGFIGGAEGWGVSWSHSARPNTRGVFQSEITADGDAQLIITAKDYVQKRVHLGRLDGDRHKIEITLDRPDTSVMTQLTLDGKPVNDARVRFHDVTDMPQVSTYVKTDADGRFPTDLLLEGRRYTVGVKVPGDKPHELRLVTWDRRKSIAVEKLGQDFEGDDE